MNDPEPLEYPFNLINSPPDMFMAAFVNALSQQLGTINLAIGYIDDELKEPSQELDRKHIKEICTNLYSTVDLARTILNIGVEYDNRARNKD